MKRKTKLRITAGLAVLAGLIIFAIQESLVATAPPAPSGMPAHGIPPPSPVNGRITMIDLGATECIPCKMMAPIIEELKIEYAGKADIVFIDVWKDPAQAQRYGIQAIPTQIFFDGSGKEVYRHTGFMDKERIIGILSNLGVT